MVMSDRAASQAAESGERTTSRPGWESQHQRMNATDYEAMVYDGDEYCVGCLPEGVTEEEATPIIADSELDRYPTCAHCGAVHDYVGLTREGLIYEAERQHGEIFFVAASEFASAKDSDTWMEDRMNEQLDGPGDWDDAEAVATAAAGLAGYYVWCCLPGCLPDSEADGPHKSPEDAAGEYLGL